ncbi:MAG: ABC transporter ATP-binding protein [Clostridiaceae bacterium]|nr:ABC transporter ATP-binding protein [Clostridiaceae bacterium]
MESCAIKVRNLEKKYHKKYALRGLNVDLHENQLIGLIGANGSGKTTFFKICAGFEAPTAGAVEMYGLDPVRDIRMKEEIIYSMHDLPVGKNWKLKKIITFYQTVYPHFDTTFCEKVLDLLEVPETKKVKQLSQGMKSIFHYVCALSARCQVTLLDEPFIGMDIEKRKACYEILLRDYMEYPRTIIVSSHNLAELEGVLSEMLLIDHGRVIFYQDMDSVREMLFRAEGDMALLEQFTKEEKYLYRQQKEIAGFAVFEGSVCCETAKRAERAGLTVSPVSPEDVSVYLTKKGEERELSCLWEK